MTRTPEQIVAALSGAAGLVAFDELGTWQDALFTDGALSHPEEPDRALLADLANEYVELDRHAHALPARAHQNWLEQILQIPRSPVVPDRVVVHPTIDPKLAPARLPIGTLLRGGKDAFGRERRYATVDVLTAHGAALAGLRTLVPGGNTVGRPGAAGEAPAFPLDVAAAADAQHRLRIWSPALVFDGGTMHVRLSFKSASGVQLLEKVVWHYSLPDGAASEPTLGHVSGDHVDLKLTGACGLPGGAIPWIEAVVPSWVDVPEGLTFSNVEISVTSRTPINPQAAFYNDGAVDVSKEFQPFGAVAKRGDAFYIRCDEAFGKALHSVKVTVELMAGGGVFSSSAGGSGIPKGIIGGLTQQLELIKDMASGTTKSVAVGHAIDKLKSTYLSDSGSPEIQWQRRVAGRWQSLGSPKSAFTGFDEQVGDPLASEIVSISGQSGHYLRAFLSSGDFGWTDYKQKVADFATKSLTGAKPTMPTAPEPPIASSITVEYSTLPVSASHVESLSGWRRHGLRNGSFQPFRRAVDETGLSGMVALGLELPGSALGSTVSVWFELDSAAPCGSSGPVAAWWEWWSGSAWQRLPVADGSRALRESGLVRFVAPHGWAAGCIDLDAESGHWLRLVTQRPELLGVIRAVTTDAVVAAFVSAERDPQTDPSSATLLPPGTIKGTVSPVKGVKKATNLSSVRGRGPEDHATYRRRASALARHRGRALAPWDYEQHVALGFPEIAAVRCLPHTRSDGAREAGSVGMLVLPDRPLEPAPRPSVSLVGRITDLLAPMMPIGAQVAVVCPLYVPVTVIASVTLRRGVAALTGLEGITSALERLLHPLADGPARWGQTLYASTLVAVLERVDVVDVVTDMELRDQDGNVTEVVSVDACRGLYCSSGAHVIQVEEQL